MNIERRQKYLGHGRSISTTGMKYNIKYDLSALNLMCSYIISENGNIRRSHLISMRNLFDIIDISFYINDPDKLERINFIKKGLEGRLIQGLVKSEMIIKYINGGIIEDNIIDLNNFSLMSNSEIDWINETVSGALKYIFIENDIDRMIDISTRFKSSDYNTKEEIVREVEELIDDMKIKFRRNKVENSREMTFTLKEGIFEEQIRDIHQIITNPNRIIKTGMQGFNEIIGGGFESTRVYMLLGLTGVGKSLALLNIAYQVKKYNKHYKTKDPSKIPVVVILTMENTVVETITRLFQIATSSGNSFKDYSPEQIINILRTEGELYLTDESPIDMVVKFVPDKSVDTSYLFTLTEDLEDEGYEVIMLIQDHIKRIRSIYPSQDVRFELGSIVNEFKTYAQLKDVVVLTNSHLNRDAARTIDNAKIRNQADLIRTLGRSNIGESMLMLDNLDGAYIIEKEYDSDGNLYMGFNKMKSRVFTNRDCIFQPFVSGNDIKFIEDANMATPIFKDTLRQNIEPSSLPFNNGINNRYQQNIKSIELKNDIDDDNIFSTTPISIDSFDTEQTTYNNEIEEYTYGAYLGLPSKPKHIKGLIYLE